MLKIRRHLEEQLQISFERTKAFEYGVIDKNGKVLKTNLSDQELEAWDELTQIIVRIRTQLDKVPAKHGKLFREAAIEFLMHEPISKILSCSKLTDEQLSSIIFEESDYMGKVVDGTNEDAPVNAAGLGGVASIGVGPQGEPGYTSKRTFRGHKVFDVDFDSFYKVRFGKNRYHKYSKYVGEDEVGKDIRNFGRTNPDEGIILQNTKTDVMTFLKFPKKGKV